MFFKSVLYILVLFFPTNILNLYFPPEFNLMTLKAVGPLRQQSWGTCWAHATTASMESSILRSGNITEKINLSSYYLDKYNGFNKNGKKGDRTYHEDSGQGESFVGSNSDDRLSGVTVHMGGDYKMSAAFIANHGGIPTINSDPITTNSDYRLFGNSPFDGIIKRQQLGKYFPQKIEFITAQPSSDTTNNFRIKRSLILYGSVASLERFNEHPSGTYNGHPIHFYKGEAKPTHAVTIIGWSDSFKFKSYRGAWIIRDSYHKDKYGKPVNFYYTPYADQYIGKDRWMGGVSFRNIIYQQFDKIYYHSLHGWQYSTNHPSIEKVANKFHVKKGIITGIGIWHTQSPIKYSIEISQSNITNTIKKISGTSPYIGFEYINFSDKITVKNNQDYYVKLDYMNKKYPYDTSFFQYVALGENMGLKIEYPIFIKSRSEYDESFVFLENEWRDVKSIKSIKVFQDNNWGILKNENNINWSMSLYGQK